MTTKAKKDYSLGKIYKIEPTVDHDEGDIYIGCTTKKYLSQRMTAHSKSYKRWKEGKCRNTTSFNLFDKYGIENCNILLLEMVKASSYDELVTREAYFIRNMKCVNKVIPLRTKEEFYDDNKEKIKEYSKNHYILNRTIYRQKHNEYDQQHRNEIREYHKQYYEGYKDTVLKKSKQYYEANKEKILKRQKEYYQRKKQEKESLGNV